MPDKYSRNNVLILGATGRVGRLLHPALSFKPANDFRFWWQSRRPDACSGKDWIQWDFADNPDGARRLTQIDGPIGAIISFAGVTSTAAGENCAANTSLARAACKAALLLSVPHVLLASSVAVYGPHPDGQAFRESDPCNPVTDYGRAKYAMEREVLQWQSETVSAPSVTYLRIGNVAGADQLLSNAAAAKSEKPLLLDRFRNGRTPRRSYIGPATLSAVLSSLLRAAFGGRDLPSVLNVAAPGGVFMQDLVQAARGAALAVPYEFQQAGPAAVADVRLNTRLLETFHTFSNDDGLPAEMVRQWLACQDMT